MPRKAKRAKNFDRRLWNRFWQIARPYWFGNEKWKARGLLALLLLLLFGRTEFTVLFNQETGEFTSALAARDTTRFWHSIHYFGIVLVAAAPIYAFYYYVRDRLGIAWRRWLTHGFLERYLSNRAYYLLGADPNIDNPDQRIAADIATFTQKSLGFLLDIIGAVLQLIAFSGILWSISKPLVIFLVMYAIFGTWITFGIFGKPMIGLNFQQLRREADLRFSLIRVREHAEAIAFYRGEAQEMRHVRGRFRELYHNYLRLLRRTLGLNFFQYAYSFVTLVVPSIIVAPRIISGELEVGRAVQASGAFAVMLSALTVFVENFETLSAFAAGIERLHSFSKALNPHGHHAHQPNGRHVNAVHANTTQASAQHVNAHEGNGHDKAQDPNHHASRQHGGGQQGTEQHTNGHHSEAHPTIIREPYDRLELDHVTVQTPNYQRTLLNDVSFSVDPGDGLLIVGASGGGKSSLLRAIAGLWNAGSGTIRHPKLEDTLFLPQRPYMIVGSLREQLLYPHVEHDVPDDELRRVLNVVNLPDLEKRCGGFDSELDFAKVLSMGEQQRLAVARVLLSKPRFAVLDEATSALDPKNEAMLYEELKQNEITLISVAHRHSVLEHHDHVLEVTGDGSWRVCAAKGYTFES
ncbi:MAG: ABC transporter ATP-binding protein/permease [Myxococcota bacterium]